MRQPQPLQPLVSIIVLGWGGEKYISMCLEALLRQTYPACEIIVVDNASPDLTAEIVARDFSSVRLIRTLQNLGVAGGNNVGLKAAQGDILILTNVDTQARPEWVARLVAAMVADPTIGVAGSKLLYPDGRIQYGGGRFMDVQGFAYHVDRFSPDRPDETEIQETDFATGAALAIRREVLERIGFEDEAYFPIDYEDPDICYRARLAGWRVCYIPAAVSIHYESSTVQSMAPHRVLSSMMGRLRFICKFWSDEQLRGDFIGAEAAWLKELEVLQSTQAVFTYGIMPLIYLKTLLDVDDVVAWRQRLGIADAETSRRTLSELLTRLRIVCMAQPQSAIRDDLSGVSYERVYDLLENWFVEGRNIPDTQYLQALLRFISTLSLSRAQVNSQFPIAWPHWPRGVWPKVRAVLQKTTRRLLRWYIDPIVDQQNQINIEAMQIVNTLAQEMFLMRYQWATQEKALRAEIELLKQKADVSVDIDADSVTSVIVDSADTNAAAMARPIHENIRQDRVRVEVGEVARAALQRGMSSVRFDENLYSALHQLETTPYTKPRVNLALDQTTTNPLFGLFMQRIRAELHQLVIYYVNMSAEQQRFFNAYVVQTVKTLIEALEEEPLLDELAALQGEVAQLREHLGSLEADEKRAKL